MNDYVFQLNYVKSQAKRIAALQDTNPASPSYGCFHYSYWRDKTSEFPDGRFQEVAATLALLAHPKIYSSDIGISQTELIHRFEIGLANWQKQQHSDGTFDEWYKHEHGFAVTTFTTIAFGIAIYFMRDSVSENCLNGYAETVRRCAAWLSQRDDFVKYNHQMAAAAALAITAKNLNDPQISLAAKRKFKSVLENQHEEGWFTEINGMDLGYCSVILDYGILFQFFENTDEGTDALVKLFDFLLPHVMPDSTIPFEAGLCLNAYVSRFAAQQYASKSLSASKLFSQFNDFSSGFIGISPILSDDLRLCRWSYLPLICQLFNRPDQTTHHEFRNVPKFVYHADASLISLKTNLFHLSFAPAGGGQVRIVSNQNPSFKFEDLGYLLELNSKKWTHVGYDPKRSLKVISSSEFILSCGFYPAEFMFPGFISRLFLRVLGAIPGAPRYIRAIIDFIRKRKRTAINQSAGGVSKDILDNYLVRHLKVTEDSLTIIDSFVVEMPRADFKLVPQVKIDNEIILQNSHFEVGQKMERIVTLTVDPKGKINILQRDTST
jgi:hypothetical protein